MPSTQLTMNHMIAGQQTGTQFNHVILGCRRPFHSLIQSNEIGRQLIISRYIVVTHASTMHETAKLKASRSDGFTFIGRMHFYLCCRLSRGDPVANSCRAGPLRRQTRTTSVPQELAFLCLTSLTMSSKLETTFTPPNSSLASLTAPSLHSPGLRIRRASIPADVAPWKSLEQA